MVEWKKLGEVCSLKARIGWQGLTQKEHRTTGEYLLVTGTDFTSNYEVDFDHCVYVDEDRYTQDPNIQLKPRDVLITKDGTLGKMAIIENLPKPATLNGGLFVIRDLTGKLHHKYLLHYMLSSKFQNIIESNHTNGTIKHLTQALLTNFPIPIPTLIEQERIVGILDTFTSSIDNLKQQIAQRRKQYEYYRDQLLDLEGKEGVEMKMLGDFCDTLSGFPFDSSQFRDEGIQLMRGANIKRGYFDFSQELNKYWISSEGLEKYLLEPNDIIISMDGSLVGRSFCYLRSDHLPLLLVQRVARIRTKENYKYVYYNITKSFPDYVDKKKTAGAIPHISMKDINSFIIPVPSLSEQQRIVDILDKFETSIQNLEAQLSQREKQYEYYRNKLLTFED